MAISADGVWARIVQHSGSEFRQKLGKAFTSEARGRTIHLHTTNYTIGRTSIDRALEWVPFGSTAELQDLPAPSYIYGVLMDDRIRRSDW